VIRRRIALVVPGRFHAFDLARALAQRGHEVVIFTNYPTWAVARFDVGPVTVRSHWVQGITGRGLGHLPAAVRPARAEGWLLRAFGRWAATALEGSAWDLVHCWSGVSEELLRSRRVVARDRWLMRGSSHIAVQDRLLAEEEVRAGVPVERPSQWMVARELREYALADRVVVLSSFARRTFEQEGYPADKLVVVPLGVDVGAFRPPADRVEAREARIRRGTPLQVLYAGTLSLRKGLWDLEAALEQLGEETPVEVRLVGPETPEAQSVLRRMGSRVRLMGKRAQRALPPVYWDADLFIFPTIEDGFGLVLTQAKAAGLPILCTAHSAGPDLVSDNVDGWIVPIRSPELLAARVRWCHEHREALARMARRVATHFQARDWSSVAEAFEAAMEHRLARPQQGQTA
jgi:glycosyltransferase involved in cell wall biosynthesis